MGTRNERALTAAEAKLVEWLIRNGEADSHRFLCDLASRRVVDSCDCGCASVDFVAGRHGEVSIIADFVVTGPDGLPGGVFLFTRGDRLAGLDLHSPGEPIAQLPNPAELKRIT